MRCIWIIALLATSWAAARAQPVLSACLDESAPALARIEVCSRVLDGTSNQAVRSRGLFGRAQARLDMLAEAPEAPPPDAYAPVLADLDESLRALQSEAAHSLRAVARFQQGSLAPGLLPLFRAGEWEAAAERLGPMIDAEPARSELLFLRAVLRVMSGDQPGADRDRQRARQIIAQTRR